LKINLTIKKQTMKSSGIKILALITILLISVASFAANGKKRSVDQRATLQMQKINQVCNLTTKQQAQVKQVFVAKITSQQALNQQNGKKAVTGKDKRAAKSAARKANKQHTGSSLNSILTPEQIALWSAYKKSLR
jgi:hypothetical protein